GLHRVKPGHERITRILEFLGNPQDETPSVIIAGTNGKGSVASAIASVLVAQGYKTGLYTSPHLVEISERIKINGVDIQIDDFYRLIFSIRKASSNLKEEPSYFEVITAAAFLHFAEVDTDFSVFEVGMGGRWDATNVVHPMVSVITNISKDHTEFLGNEISQIAAEKSGVIKEGVPVITGAIGEASEVIVKVAHQKNAPIMIMGKDFSVEGKSTKDFSYTGQDWNLDHLEFSLPGVYQLENVSLSVAAVESMNRLNGVKIDPENLRKGLSTTKWEGRLEIIRNDPPLILDGAHNPGAASALRKSIQAMFPGIKFLFLIGMLADKDHENYIGEISHLAERIIITNVPSERGMNAERLAEISRRYVKMTSVIEDSYEAFNHLKGISFPACVTGSLYLIGAIKRAIKHHNLLL
ncbi:MAG: bifunctional folylpolyglutamate synthase/dihydrofolate synthase, partial [Thermodesulfobacteriota bacterium]